MTFGDKLRRIMEHDRIGHTALVRKMGLPDDHRTHVANWLRSKSGPSPEKVQSISEALVIPSSYWASNSAPQGYLRDWLKVGSNADAMEKMEPRERLTRLIDELARAWPGADKLLLGSLTLTEPAELTAFLHGEARLETTQLGELCAALGIRQDLLATTPRRVDPEREEKWHRILTACESLGWQPSDLLLLVSAIEDQGIGPKEAISLLENRRAK